MEEIIDATESTHGYLVSPLTDHISETEEGYLVVVGCPVARTGFQEYSVRDLNQDAARELGVDVSNPGAAIDLYRPANEVFAPEFLASLNGKAITDNHPPEFLDKDNQREYAMGHIQNPRRGDEPLDDGEWPLVADLIITAEPLISKVRDKQQREISLGYDYGIRREGSKIIQCDLLANHVAIVPKGRAGDLVAIQDAAPEVQPRAAPVVETAPAPPQTAAAQDKNATPTQDKEKPRVAITWKSIFGRGLKDLAKDPQVTDDEMAQAAAEAHKLQSSTARARAADADPAIEAPEDEDVEPIADARRARDKRHGRDRRTRDKRRGRDEDPAIEAPEDEDVEPTYDRRSKLHDALDRVMDRAGEDADMEELKNLLGQFLTEEEEEPEHAAADEEEGVEAAPDVSELEQVVGEPADDRHGRDEEEVVASGEEELEDRHADDRVAEEDSEEEEEAEEAADCAFCGEAMDADDKFCASCGKAAEDKHRGRDRARAADGALAVLKIMKPYVARSNDRSLKVAFNTALSATTRGSRAASSSYGGFAGAARARDKAGKQPPRSRAADASQDGGADRNAKLQAAYDAALKGGK